MPRLQDESQKVVEKLRREHVKLDHKVQVLESQRWLSPSEETEVKRLKRLKLAKKDQMRTLRPEA